VCVCVCVRERERERERADIVGREHIYSGMRTHTEYAETYGLILTPMDVGGQYVYIHTYMYIHTYAHTYILSIRTYWLRAARAYVHTG
jgi:hypothetical protein